MDTFQGMFADTEWLIAEATKELMAAIVVNREDANRLKVELAESVKLTNGLAGLLLDSDMAPVAKDVIKRQIAAEGSKQVTLQSNIEQLGDRANRSAERLAERTARALETAKASLAAVAGPEQLHAFVDRFVGPSVAFGDGRVVQAGDEAEAGGGGAGASGIIAATGIEPVTFGL